MIDSGADVHTTIAIPGGITVPDNFTWTLQVIDRLGPNMKPMGPAHYGAASVGVVFAGAGERPSGGSWTRGPVSEAAFGTRFVACYSNCDGSTNPPTLNVGDFTCFLQRFAADDPYANCDESTAVPRLNVGDFTCFLQKFAAGCP